MSFGSLGVRPRVVCGRPGTAALGQPTPSALEGLRWDAGRKLPAQKAGLENQQPKSCTRSGALSDQCFPHDPAHSCLRPAHTPSIALSRPTAPYCPAGTENSGLRNVQAWAARGAPTARARAGSQAPSPPLRRDLVRPGRPDGWRPPLLQPGAGFSNLTFGRVAAAQAVALVMEGQILRGPELRPAGLPAQQVSEEGSRLQVLKRSFCLDDGKFPPHHRPFASRIPPWPGTKN